MRQQIERLSPHQNAKVFAIVMAVGSLFFMVPFMLFAIASAPPQARPPVFFLIGMPFMYLVMSYLSVIIGCWLYNVLYRYIGGIEFEARGVDA